MKYAAHLLRHIIKTVHPCTLLMASFGKAETSLLLNTSGIRAATDNPQRIKDAPAVLFYLSPCIYAVYLQKAYGKDISGTTRLHNAYIVFLNTKPAKPQEFLKIDLHGYHQFFLFVLCALSGLCIFLISPQRRRDRKGFSKDFLFGSNYTSPITNYQLFYAAIYYLLLCCFDSMGAGETYKLKGGEKYDLRKT